MYEVITQERNFQDVYDVINLLAVGKKFRKLVTYDKKVLRKKGSEIFYWFF